MNLNYIRSLIKLVEESEIEELEKEVNILGIIPIHRIRIRKYLGMHGPQIAYKQNQKPENIKETTSLAKIVKGESYHNEYNRHSLFSEHVHPGHSTKLD